MTISMNHTDYQSIYLLTKIILKNSKKYWMKKKYTQYKKKRPIVLFNKPQLMSIYI